MGAIYYVADQSDRQTAVCSKERPKITPKEDCPMRLPPAFSPDRISFRRPLQSAMCRIWPYVLRFACLVALATLCMAAMPLRAQTAHFSYAQRTLTSSLSDPYDLVLDGNGNIYLAESGNGVVLKAPLTDPSCATASDCVSVGSALSQPLSYPSGVAVDASGNIYIADAGNNRVLMVPATDLSCTTASDCVSVGSALTTPLSNPEGVAADASGNVYISDTYNHRVLKVPSTDLACTMPADCTTVGSGMVSPDGLAVDASGNVYIADYTSSIGILMETYSGGTYTQSLVGSGLSVPTGVTVDASGNIYIASSGGNVIIKETYSGGTYTQSTMGIGLDNPTGVAIAANGDIYAADYNDSRVVLLDDVAGNFNTEPVASTSATESVAFIFDTGGTLASTPYSVLTQGAPNLDFNAVAIQPTSVCVTGQTYNAGDTCTVDVALTPTLSGPRNGAVALYGSAGSQIAGGYVYGMGVGPQMVFSPGSQSVVETGTQAIWGMTVDASGNVYTADNSTSIVTKATLSGGTYTPSLVTNTGINGANGLAVDGSGNLYIADTGTGTVVMETPSGTGYTQSTLINGIDAVGIAVDGSGNLYISEFGNNDVLKETASNGAYIQSVVVSGLNGPQGLVIDGNGNLYIAETIAGDVVKETLSGGVYTQSIVASGLNDPESLAVDVSGNVYIADANNARVLKETLAGGVYTQSVAVNCTGTPISVAVDGSGNLYIADFNNQEVFKEDYTDAPSLSFASTNVGATSTDSPQTLTVGNIGNASLNFTAAASIAANFALDTTASGTCGAAAMLASGASCTLPISFTPTTPGSNGGSLVLTDNNLNAAAPTYVTQTISLSGSGLQQTPVVTWVAPSAMSYGAALGTVLNATALSGVTPVAGTLVYTATAGGNPTAVTSNTVLAANTYMLAVTFTPTDAAMYTTATGAVTLVVNQVAPSVSLVASANSVMLQNAVTLTATVSSTGGTPTGTVTFLDGTSALGSGSLTNGVAAMTTSTLRAGQHSITAVYSGDANFTTATTSALSESVLDFNLALSTSNGGSTSQTITSGGTATYSVVVNPLSGTTFPAAVSFSASGLPAGATATFSPQTIAAGSGSTPVTLTVQLSSATASAQPENHSGRGLAPIAFAMLLLPFSRRARQSAKKLGRLGSVALLLFVALGAMASLTGCNVAAAPASTQQPQNYDITVTATSGALTRSTSVALTVQ
jgi:sugar lactone lactonase YvrE